MAVKCIDFLNVPIDILPEEDIEETVLNLLERKGVQQIIFMTIWDVLKARRNSEFREMVLSSALRLPISKSIVRGIRFLKKEEAVRRQQFSVIIDFLNVINVRYKSLYLLGGRPESLLIAEKNVRSTFTGIKIVGRFKGYYNKSIEPQIISAISKAEPSIVLVGNGIQSGRKWIYRNKNKFNSGIFIRDADILDIFSKFKKRQSQVLFDKGLDYIPKILKNPFRVFNIFGYFWFNILLVFYKFFRNNDE